MVRRRDVVRAGLARAWDRSARRLARYRHHPVCSTSSGRARAAACGWIATAAAWSGATPLGTGAVGGNPVVASAGQGSDTVFWRDASGDLWADTGASWGWSGAVRLTSTALSADPSVSAASTSIDVFWNSAGELWHGALSGGTWTGAAALGTEAVAGNPSVVDLAPGSVIVDFARAIRADGVVAVHVRERPGGSRGPRCDGVLGPVVGGVRRRRRHRRRLAVQLQHALGRPACPGCAAPAIPVFTPAG